MAYESKWTLPKDDHVGQIFFDLAMYACRECVDKVTCRDCFVNFCDARFTDLYLNKDVMYGSPRKAAENNALFIGQIDRRSSDPAQAAG